MKSLLFLLFLAPISLFAQLRDSVYIKTDIYECVYSEVLEQPKWIKYTVLCPEGNAPRKGMDFYTEQGIKTSDNADYANNIYDKGHMAPAADFNCTKEMLYKTFSYVNCALQNQDLNRVAWRLLESAERDWARAGGDYYIISGGIWDAGYTKTGNGLGIPTRLYKIIYNKTTKQVKAYIMPNAPISPATDWPKYETTLANVQAATGMQFKF